MSGVPSTQDLLLAHRHTIMMNIVVAIIKTKPVDSPAMTGRVKILPDVTVVGGDEEENGVTVVIGIVELVSVAPGDEVT